MKNRPPGSLEKLSAAELSSALWGVGVFGCAGWLWPSVA